MDSALHTDLGGAAVSSFYHTLHHLAYSQLVRLPAQIFGEPALGEGAELAAKVADVGVIDVAIDDVGHVIAVPGSPLLVGQQPKMLQLGPASRKECLYLTFLEPATAFGARQHRRYFRTHHGRGRAHRWWGLSFARVPRVLSGEPF